MKRGLRSGPPDVASDTIEHKSYKRHRDKAKVKGDSLRPQDKVKTSDAIDDIPKSGG